MRAEAGREVTGPELLRRGFSLVLAARPDNAAEHTLYDYDRSTIPGFPETDKLFKVDCELSLGHQRYAFGMFMSGSELKLGDLDAIEQRVIAILRRAFDEARKAEPK